MSRHDLKKTLRQMRDHAAEAIDLLASKERGVLDRDRILALAVTRLVEVVGEAARRVPPEDRSGLDGIPWQEVAGMRDKLIHGYDQVDLDVLWETVVGDMPALVDRLDEILRADA